MKIPKKIKVGGKTYTVVQGYQFMDSDYQLGRVCHGTLRILLSDKTASGEPLARANVEEVFLHELLHCVDYAYNAGGLGEDTTDGLAQGLYQALNDNGLLAGIQT